VRACTTAARQALLAQDPTVADALIRVVYIDAALLALAEHGVVLAPRAGLRVNERRDERHRKRQRSRHDVRHRDCGGTAAAMRTWTFSSSQRGRAADGVEVGVVIEEPPNSVQQNS